MKIAPLLVVALTLAACTAAPPRRSAGPAPKDRISAAVDPLTKKSAAPTAEARMAWSRAVYAFELGDYGPASEHAAAAIEGGLDSLETRLLHEIGRAHV